MAQQMMVYLDKAVLAVKSLGIGMDSKEDSPIVALLQKTSLIDADAALGLAKVLREASMFNDMVRTQIAGMEISNRYEVITDSFNSIKEDCQTLVLQASDGKMDFKEKIQHHWMNMSRGSVPSRFEKVRDVYMEVSNDLNEQIVREQTILSAYKDYRVAMKEGQIIALGMLKSATTKLDTLRVNVSNANDDLAKSVGDDILKAQLELTRDHKVREYQEFDRI